MRRRSYFRTIATVLCILILLGVLGGLFYYDRMVQRARIKRSEEMNFVEESSPAQEAAEESSASEAEETVPAETPAPTPEETPTPTPEPTPTETPTPTPTPTPEPTPEPYVLRGVSLRGDDLKEDVTGRTSTVEVYLTQLLAAEHADIPVEDNTWEMSGTLSQLALAGVDEAEIEKILTEHKANAELKDLTDLQLRDDVADVFKERQDTGYLPVLCMGYYGGWARDPEELVEEYKLLLATYDDPEEYIIYGVCPYVYTDIAGYDEALTAAFGDHYVSFTSLGRPVMTANNRKAIAEGLFEKMKELGYLS